MPKRKKLENELFVIVAGDPNEEYYSVEPKPEAFAEIGLTLSVGRYRLVERLKVTSEAKLTIVKDF